MDAAQQFRLSQQAAVRYEQFLGPLMTPFVSALLEVAGVGPGDDVLDVACGTGFVARAAAGATDGRLVGCDLNPAMLEVAARAAGTAAIEWRQGPAEALPVDDASFDVVLCQQGLQFVPDLGAALEAAARVLRPGGRFAATTWAALDRSPYMRAQYDALTAALGDEATRTFTAAFRIGADELETAAIDAGLLDVDVVEISPLVHLPSLPGYAADHLSALPWGQALLRSGPDALAAVARDMTDRLAGHQLADGSIEVAFSSLLVTARR